MGDIISLMKFREGEGFKMVITVKRRGIIIFLRTDIVIKILKVAN